MEATSSESNRTSPMVWVAFVLCTLFFAFGSTWPFFTAWKVRYSPAYEASAAWVLSSASVGELVGTNRYTENDTFPKGGAEDGKARFEHRLVGDTRKAKVAVILEERAGAWTPVRAAWLTEDDEWAELKVP